ncbi:membrane dipeptidase [Maribellus sediminis]|uniref:membrane dipeptidase n=1 Tax=Maribellus sediminis TaxID=2696285 RepID=UPI00142F59F0|nr:membrane dipeptidase [Maribellus sediminis]
MSEFDRFADLHCHPHMRSFNWLHKHRRPEINSRYNPWWIILPKQKAEEKGRRAAAYTQCDLAKIMNGNLKLAFVSLYPLERGWVTGRSDSKKIVARNLKKYLGDNLLNEAVSSVLNHVLQFIGNDEGGGIAVRDFIQAVYMKIPLRRVNFVQSRHYDYFEELKEEREFLLKRNELLTESELYIPFPKRLFVSKKKILAKYAGDLEATGTYEIAKNGAEVDRLIKDDKTAFVLTIEGANVFNSNEEYEAIEQKLAEIKSWEQPLFFITFTHHFYNYLAGHAHSIPDTGNLLLDQSEGMNSGITEKGKKVLRYLLAIDEDGKFASEKYGRRILIDVKHLSAKARKEYYNDFVLPALKTAHPIPVIASHVAYSGVEKLDELIARMPEEKNGDFSERYGHKFNNWNINICDEDVKTIFKTDGVVGINLDQRVLGVTKGDIKKNETHASYVWQNIKSMMKAVIISDDPEIKSKKEIVNTFCLGTDFDGFIDPLNEYPTVLDFKKLAADLVREIDKDPEKDMLLFGLSTEKFVKKICFDNAFDFVTKHFI